MYAKSLKPLSSDAKFEQYRMLRHELAYFSSTRPDLCAATDVALQVTADSYNRKHVRAINKLVHHIWEMSEKGLRYHKPDRESLKLVATMNASFGNSQDLSSYFGHIIILMDIYERDNVSGYTSKKSEMVM